MVILKKMSRASSTGWQRLLLGTKVQPFFETNKFFRKVFSFQLSDNRKSMVVF